MSRFKNNHDNRKSIWDGVLDDVDQQEQRNPFPGRKLPTTVDWARFGPAAVDTSSNRSAFDDASYPSTMKRASESFETYVPGILSTE